jgi:progressive ankylosis protein
MGHLRYREIFQFYWPLLLTSQMMTLAAPIINMGLGRNTDARTQLAAYAVGFGLLVFLNSPLFPILQTVAALGSSPRARRSLLIKGMSVALPICAIEIWLALSGRGLGLISTLMGATPEVAALAQKVALVQFPIALLLPIRAYYSGIVMRHRDTRIISLATGMRLALLASIIFGALGLGHIPGAVLGASSLTLGIFIETAYMIFRGKLVLRRSDNGVDDTTAENGPVSWHAFLAFIAPLMINAMTWSLTRPLLNAIIGRSSDPLTGHAGFGFVFPLLVLSSSPLWAFQSTTLVLAKGRNDLIKMFRFGGVTISLFIVGIGVVVWSPLRDILLHGIFSLELPMIAYVAPALMIIPFQPITLGLRTISHGYLMARRKTRAIGVASLIKVMGVALAGFPLVHFFPDLNGAVLGTAMLMGGEACETVIILATLSRLCRRSD